MSLLADAPTRAASPLADTVARATRSRRTALALLVVALLIVAGLALGTGAIAIPPSRVVAVLLPALAEAGQPSPADVLLVRGVRLPRLVATVLTGGVLGVAGALMQGLFRNPLADPGLIGVSAGSGFAAALIVVLGDRLFGPGAAQGPLLPLGAFLGGLAVSLLLYAVASRGGRTSVATVLLAGIAISALAVAAMGILVYLADDRQLRDITFWTMGSFGGTNWSRVAVTGPLMALAIVAAPFLARGLDALVFGEAEARHLGIPIERVKLFAILATALGVGAAVATAGMIGFVGIVVPHLVRIAIGPGHRALLPASALLGATLLTLADMVARVIVAPAELPIGIVTAVIGAPVFLHLILKRGGAIS